jgi:RNA-directed DNA polymerase
MAAKLVLDQTLEPLFHRDSYGYRPNRSAHQAIAITRKRCWKYDWVVEFDIRGCFDNISHTLLDKALVKHIKCKWLLLYVRRWLKAPMLDVDGQLVERGRGIPQGGVVSPVLMNLFLHYVFDTWMDRNFPSISFCRYADDGLVHCTSLEQAEFILSKLRERFTQCDLELHPDKTKIIYCQDVNRIQQYHAVTFDFLGYTFRPRSSRDKYGRRFVNFLPAVSGSSLKDMRQTIRHWKIQLKSEKSLEDISRFCRK